MARIRTNSPLIRVIGCAACGWILAVSLAVAAESNAWDQALTATSGSAFYQERAGDHAFSLSSSTFSSSKAADKQAQTPWSTPKAPYQGDGLASAPGVYALLVDGKYDFNYENDGLSPYLGGGLGLAAPSGTTAAPGLQVNEATPLMRFGGGVAYRMGKQWDLSLDYQAGASPNRTPLFTSRGQQQPIDMQSLNMGVKLKF